MSKKCAKCEKTVYPTEELKCLDKIWHKGCFKCQVCNMTLNMKNYKGYDKWPYCNAHYPTTKHTQVADTPEMKRIAENTAIQSQVEYHSDFEKSKGQLTEVPDPLFLKQHLENTKNFSLVEYHSDFEKSRGHITEVADPLFLKQHLENTKNFSLVDYHSEFEKSRGQITEVADPLFLKQHLENTKNFSLIDYHSDFEKLKGYSSQLPDTLEMKRHKDNFENFSLVKYHQEFEKLKGKKISVDEDPETARVKQHMKTVSNVAYHGTLEQKQQMEDHRPQHGGDQQQFRRNPGKISDYEPPVQSGGTPYSQRTSQTNVVYDSEIGKDRNVNARRHYSSGSDSMESSGSGRRVGSIADYDPMNDRYGSIAGQAPKQYNPPPQQYQPPPQQYQPPPQQYQPPPQQQYQPPPQQYSPPQQPQPPVDRESKGIVCKAMYDYTAADDDEVSFIDGDEITFCQAVDAGWMMGTVRRTGQRGMLPSNYVEQVK